MVNSSMKNGIIEWITLILCIVIFCTLLIIVTPFCIVNFSHGIGFLILSAIWFGFASINIVFAEIFYHDAFTILFTFSFAIAISMLVIFVIHLIIHAFMMN